MNKITLQGGDSSNNWTNIGEYILEASTDYTKEKTININTNTPYNKFRFYASRTDQLDSFGGLAFQFIQFYCINVP